jgi:hypothetical protein
LTAVPAGKFLQYLRDEFGVWNRNRLWQDNVLSALKTIFFLVGLIVSWALQTMQDGTMYIIFKKK